jgi:aspartate/methionine/tyrosine aminotransferase
LVIINPGNPTGQVLDPANMKEVGKYWEDYIGDSVAT